MTELTLIAAERCMHGHGRARMNERLLNLLGIKDNAKIEVIASDGTRLSLTAFGDSLVEESQIRISGEDLKILGIAPGDTVIVRRKIPVKEQVKTAAEELSLQLSKEIADLKEVVSHKTSHLQDETALVADEFKEKARELSETITDGITPIGVKISEAGKETVATIQEHIPTAQLTTIETGLKSLNSGDAMRLKNVLIQNEGNIRAVWVTSDTVIGRTIQNLTLPPEVIIVGVLRTNSSFTISTPDTVLQAGDVVYLIGKEKGLDYMSSILEG